MAKDIIEDVLGAIDIISQAKLNDMKFNKTDLCTIEKVVNKEKGEYLVASGAMKYTAWAQGETTYREGNSVYVLVPNGDYNAEKIIVGRYSASDSGVVETLSPLDVVMNMSGELVSEKREKKLIANGNIIELPITIDKETSFTGYDSICMIADFKTNIVANAGSYGLKLVIQYEDDDKETEFYLDSSDMIGDPYAFDSYFNQVKGFVLDPTKTFNVVGLSFYQLKDFMDFENKPLTKKEDNLFVKNVSVSLGINIENYTDDKVMLFVDGDTTYTLDNTNAIINLKWVHWNGSRAIVIKSLEDEAIKDLDVDIHWYRYNIGNKEKDPLLGECFWDEVKPSNLFQYSINNLNKDWKEEKFKVWIECGAAIYKSEEIVLSNLDGKHIDMTSGFIDGIYIKFPSEDRYKGNFYIYGEDLQATTLSYSRVLNKVSIDYRVNETAYDPWNDAEITINWKIPFGDTMFIEPEVGKEINKDNDVVILPKSKGGVATQFKGRTFEPLDKYYQILRTAETKDQMYRIKKDYNNTFKNNTLVCDVWRNGVLYTASQEFLFGVFGTNGTNYTFTWSTEEYDAAGSLLEREPAAITPGITNKWKFIPHVSDYEHKTVEIDMDNFGVEIFSHNASSENEIHNYYNIVNKELVVANNPLEKGYGIILKFTYKINDGKLILSRYQPIAVRASKDLAYIDGADRIIYDANGMNPTWNKLVYNIYDNNKNIIADTIEWSIDPDNTSGQYPILKEKKTNEKYLEAPTMFLAGTDGKYSFVKVTGKGKWLQPILVALDPYGSDFLNTWDGKLQINDKNDTILARTIGAGIKHSEDNTFSGTVFGDLTTAGGTSTGILGFDHGAHSYGFLTDGSAFIGKPGTGRINFDGNHGYIMSNNFNGFDGNAGTSPRYENGVEKFNFNEATPQGTYLGLSTGNSFFSGDIYAKSLQLHSDVKIDNTNLSGDFVEKGVEIGSGDTTCTIGKTGLLTANNAIISGTILAGKIGGDDGWSITDDGHINGAGLFLNANGIKTINDAELTINDFKPNGNGWTIYSNGNFGVDTTGKLFATEATISGHITATSGTIGKCSIDKDGVLKIKEANIDGKITADHIDASTLSIKSGQVTGSFSANKITAGTVNDKEVKWQETVAITNYKVYQARLEILGDDGAYHYAYVTLPYNLSAKKIYTLASVTS